MTVIKSEMERRRFQSKRVTGRGEKLQSEVKVKGEKSKNKKAEVNKNIT